MSVITPSLSPYFHNVAVSAGSNGTSKLPRRSSRRLSHQQSHAHHDAAQSPRLQQHQEYQLPQHAQPEAMEPRITDDICGRGRAHTSLSRKMDDYAAEVVESFGAPLLRVERMLSMSTRMQAEYREKLHDSSISMLPSFQHTLPTGAETGQYLALDVGGSTFRLALVRLHGGSLRPSSAGGMPSIEALHERSFVIDERIRTLPGRRFFDWMAERIEEMLRGCGSHDVLGDPSDSSPLRMGLAWSFPVEQTSPCTGRLLAMGKGFLANEGLEDEELGSVLGAACAARGLHISVTGLVNDSAATLAARAYHDPSTCMSLILGTGMNAAVYMPVDSLAPRKFGPRPAAWHASARRVVINTELSMFGRDILPITRWDERLDAQHLRPRFQPLEYMVTGRYVGELSRLVLVEAILEAGLFGGTSPAGLDTPYSLDTRVIAAFEEDDSPNLAVAARTFTTAHPFPADHPQPSVPELRFLRTLARLVSRRAAAYLAIALHALWAVRAEAEAAAEEAPNGLNSGAGEPHSIGLAHRPITIACDGSMVDKYPGFRSACQTFLDQLCALSTGGDMAATAPAGGVRAVTLEMARDSSVFGAAVAASCNVEVHRS